MLLTARQELNARDLFILVRQVVEHAATFEVEDLYLAFVTADGDVLAASVHCGCSNTGST